ncbi:MAG: fibronectin type III domain-containing protein, partial [Planctomycetota bacterium]
MRNDRLALFALPLVLALGFGVGFIVGRPAETNAAANAPVVDVERVETAAPARAADPLATPTSDVGLVSAPDADRGDALASTEARSVARRVSASVASAGTERERDADLSGALRGRVLDAGGAPVPGATVVVAARRSSARRATKTDGVGKAWKVFDELEDELARTAEQRLESRRGTTVATVDASGSFEATGLEPGGKYRARVYAEDMVGDSIDVRPGQIVEFVLQPVALFHLEPRLADGTLPNTATVVVDPGERRPRIYAWTADEPTLRLQQRVASLRILAGDVHSVSWNEYRASLTSETRTVDLDVDGEGPHVFELQPRYLLEVDLVEPGMAFDNVRPWVDARGPEDEKPRALRRTTDGPF